MFDQPNETGAPDAHYGDREPSESFDGFEEGLDSDSDPPEEEEE